MKIFNWMNRKFGSKDGRRVKKDEFIGKETDKKPLIDTFCLVDVIDVSWRDGLLTIGTLGYDQLQKLIPEEEYFHYLFPDQIGEESENDDDDNEFFEDEFFEKNNEVHEENMNSVLQTKSQMLSDLAKEDRLDTIGGKTVQPPTRNEHVVGCGFNYSGEKGFNDHKKKKVTLAELFSAETDEEKKGHNEKDNEKTKLSIECTTGHRKHMPSVKKLIPKVARVDSRLAHKLNQSYEEENPSGSNQPRQAPKGKAESNKHIWPSTASNQRNSFSPSNTRC